jgi:hypothetical protein
MRQQAASIRRAVVRGVGMTMRLQNDCRCRNGAVPSDGPHPFNRERPKASPRHDTNRGGVFSRDLAFSLRPISAQGLARMARAGCDPVWRHNTTNRRFRKSRRLGRQNVSEPFTHSGFRTELENLADDAKGKGASGRNREAESTEIRLPDAVHETFACWPSSGAQASRP